MSDLIIINFMINLMNLYKTIGIFGIGHHNLGVLYIYGFHDCPVRTFRFDQGRLRQTPSAGVKKPLSSQLVS